ncbi:formylglycine-generating enzyme family protein [Belliella marina]|uniref:Formylglycine-generating enzyme family protein n=1 Tax=Belliella marina TaxID=1644146 RepID=A0ABW4VF61_9BACT
MKYLFYLIGLFFTIGCNSANHKDEMIIPVGMKYIPGGQFTMGVDSGLGYPQESPAHQVRVNPFFMDETEVTNAQFGKFVEETGYVTVAEREVKWEDLKKQLPKGTPKPDDSYFQPGALVFTPPAEPVSVYDPNMWWAWIVGASWKYPQGPESSIEDKMDHPVVNIAYEDALAYCDWAGKRLPTEAEWEFAAQGGKNGNAYSWGNDLTHNGQFMANTFQGQFPNANASEDGFELTAPVGSYQANPFGLYDMIGNVWEWTSDWYHDNTFKLRASEGIIENPKGADRSFDAMDPLTPKRVTKGGSYLCALDYCMNYRSSARIGSADDTGMSHIGFRCVKDIQ